MRVHAPSISSSFSAQAPRMIGATSARRRDLRRELRHRQRLAAALQAFLGERHVLDHALIGFARIRPEGEDAVLVQDQPLDRAVALERVGRGLGEREARHDVGHVAEPLAVDLFAQLLALRLVGEAQHGGRVCVIDEGVRQEGVQQRLDRRVRR